MESSAPLDKRDNMLSPIAATWRLLSSFRNLAKGGVLLPLLSPWEAQVYYFELFQKRRLSANQNAALILAYFQQPEDSFIE